MKKMNLVLLVILIMTTVSCKNDQKMEAATLQGAKSGACSAGGESSATDGTLFTLEGKGYTKDMLPAALQQEIYDVEIERHQKLSQMLSSYALTLHLATKANKNVDSKNLPPLEELVKMPKLSDAEVKKFFEEKKGQMPPNIKFEDVKPQIIQYMNQQGMGKVFAEKMQELTKMNIFTSNLVAPASPEFKLDVSEFPSKGTKGSKIKVVEVSDYLCGHCQMAHENVKKIVETYKDKIEFVQVNFALRPTGLSGTYVRGGFCAQTQGVDQFWKYHDETFKITTVPHDHSAHGHQHDPAENDGKSTGAIQKAVDAAKASGLDVAKFESCVKGSEAFAWVDRVAKSLSDNGVNGTPTFFVNGKKVAGGINELESVIKSSL